MIASVIEREVLIEAPVEVVWKIVTEPDQIRQWFSDAAELDLRPGGHGQLTFTMHATSEQATVRLQVVTVEPPHTFAFRWDHPEGTEAHEGNSLLVEITLAAESGRTRLHLTESGFPKLQRTEEEKAAYIRNHEDGWDVHLARLRDHASGQS
jgi:uncharacterized protein YndB with AHSA1/START domain